MPPNSPNTIETNSLPEEITLPDGRMFTNLEIVTLKRKCRYMFDEDLDKDLIEVQKQLDLIGYKDNSDLIKRSNKDATSTIRKTNVRTTRRHG